MECEDQILRQQALATSVKRMSEHLAITPIKVLKKSHLLEKRKNSFYSFKIFRSGLLFAECGEWTP